jgi:hypothetical protein
MKADCISRSKSTTLMPANRVDDLIAKRATVGAATVGATDGTPVGTAVGAFAVGTFVGAGMG